MICITKMWWPRLQCRRRQIFSYAHFKWLVLFLLGGGGSLHSFMNILILNFQGLFFIFQRWTLFLDGTRWSVPDINRIRYGQLGTKTATSRNQCLNVDICLHQEHLQGCKAGRRGTFCATEAPQGELHDLCYMSQNQNKMIILLQNLFLEL